MNELIKVAGRHIGGAEVQTVNARDLHAFLEVGKVFADWIQERITQYGFIELRDFEVFSNSGNNPAGGRPIKEYAITLDMATELAMVERNEKGKQARQYFIECERKVMAGPALPDFTDPAEAARAWAAEYEQKKRAQALVAEQAKQIEEQRPKADFHDAVTGAVNAQSVQEIAKVLGMGPNKLFDFLRGERLLMRNNLPYQQYVDAGLFKVVEGQFYDRAGESRTYTRTLITGKGLAHIQRRIQALMPVLRLPNASGGAQVLC